jgi:hypothetical protein
MSADQAPISILRSSFEAKLPPFLKQQYKTAMAHSFTEVHKAAIHVDSSELVDGILALIPLRIDEVLGFAVTKIDDLLKAADAVCVAYKPNGKVPSHRVLICDKRYVRVDISKNHYDVATNKDDSTPKYFPIETICYSFGAVYARLVHEREAKKSSESIERQ